jgi:hypothetical protein
MATKDCLNRDEVFQRLGHLQALDMEVARVEKVIHPLVVAVVGLCDTTRRTWVGGGIHVQNAE